MRLSAETVSQAQARVPVYQRNGLSCGILHIGPGAFARAHLASFTDDILGHDPRWGIVAVSLNSPSTVQSLARQSGFYTLAEPSADALQPRIIGSILRTIDASADHTPFFDAITDPRVRVVTLTITEKAYIGETPGLLAIGLERRAAAGAPPLTVMSLDNLPNNGRVLKQAVMQASERPDTVEAIATFPCSMVDRITPAMTPDNQAAIVARVGLEDACPVLTEPFRQWVIEDDFAGPRPPWELAGAEIVADVGPYEAMKLRLLNGAHSTMAYLGQLRGHQTVAGAVGDAEFAAGLTRTATAEVMQTLSLSRAKLDAYWASLMERFSAPGIEHRLEQIAADGSQKMPIRVMAPIADLRANGAEVSGLTIAVAGWMEWIRRQNAAGQSIEDPRRDELTQLCEGSAAERVRALCELPNLVPNTLLQDKTWQLALSEALASLDR